MLTRTKLQYASLLIFSFLPQQAGCNPDNSIRDIRPEYACCITDDRSKVVVVADRVLHQFEFQDRESSVATKNVTAKTPWQGRVTEIRFASNSNLLTAVVFNVNARRVSSNGKRNDELKRNSMYCFQVQHGGFKHLRVVKDTFIAARLLDMSNLIYVTSSDQEFSNSCDVSESVIFAECTLNSDGTEIEVSKFNESETIYCGSESRVRFSTSRDRPLLTNILAAVTGKWDSDEKPTFVPMSLKNPPELNEYENAYGKDDNQCSLDVSEDQRFIGIAVNFSHHIRFSVWDTRDGELIWNSTYKRDVASGPIDSVRCFALENKRFCVGQGRFVRIVDLENKSVQEIDVLGLANEYRSATVLAAEVQAGTVELCVVFSPLDAKCVRRIRVPLQETTKVPKEKANLPETVFDR